MVRTFWRMGIVLPWIFILILSLQSLILADERVDMAMAPLEQTLESFGFTKKNVSFNGNEVIYDCGAYDLVCNKKAKVIYKEGFSFYLGNRGMVFDDVFYIEPDILAKITNKSLDYTNGKPYFKEYERSPHSWTEMNNGLVAHGGGGILGLDVTNCYEAVLTNYNRGHTIFEIDLNLTTDNRMVAVHDWVSYGGRKTAEEFKDIKISGVFKAMSLEDIYKIMLVNKDFYLITDTKSFEYSRNQLITQFQYIYQTALAFDPELLNRIIPQIYDQTMYEDITSIYPFESIIYTLYATSDSDQEVIDFIKDKDDIKVITMGPVRYGETFFKELQKYDKLVYFFTLNDLDEVRAYKEMGIHGFYTDFILPEDFE